MKDDITKLGSDDAGDNSVIIYGIEHMRSAEANADGKMYLGVNDAGGKHVKYAVMPESLVSEVPAVGGSIVMNDVAKMDTGKVGINGYLFIGSDFAEEEVTVVAKEIEPPETGKSAGESSENNQTAETTS